MTRRKALLLHIAVSLIAVVLLASNAGRLKAYLLQTEGSRPAASEPARGQNENQGKAEATSREAATTPGRASHEGEHGAEPAAEEKGPKKEIFLWVNFLVIVAFFWWLGKKYLGPYLDARGQAIREDMQQSRRAIEDAGKRLSGIEDRLKHLDAEIAGLRNSALQEAAAERARIEQMAEVDARKIATTAEQEIAAAAKVARQELKVYASELALNLAEEKIRRSISAQSDKEIFRSFVEDLRDGSNGAGNGAGGA